MSVLISKQLQNHPRQKVQDNFPLPYKNNKILLYNKKTPHSFQVCEVHVNHVVINYLMMMVGSRG